jgi:hypothetical protein
LRRKLHADNAESFEVWRLDYPDVRDGDRREALAAAGLTD